MIHLNLILYFLYLVCLALCVIAGALSWKRMRSAARIFYYFVVTVFVGELAAFTLELITGENTEFYNAIDILQSVLVFTYFTVCLNNPRTGTLLIAISIIFGIYNYFWIQQDELVNNYFLLWTGFVSIALCLYMMIFLYRKYSDIRLSQFIHFWFSLALLFYWAVNMIILQRFNELVKSNVNDAIMLNSIQIISLIISYLVIARVFYRLPQLIQ